MNVAASMVMVHLLLEFNNKMTPGEYNKENIDLLRGLKGIVGH